MKFVRILLPILLTFQTMAQDTLVVSKDYYGVKTIVVSTSKDTLQKTFYPSGQLASVMPYHRSNKTVEYKRFSESGKISYQFEIKNEQPHGHARFYDSKGKIWATLNFEEGKLIDTVFIRRGNSLVFGQVNYSSVVHGGAQNEDGTSNIQESKGVIRNMKFTLYPNDNPADISTLIGISGYSDDFGYLSFHLIKSKKTFALFPQNETPSKIYKDQVLPDPTAGMAHHTTWILNPKDGLHSKDSILRFELRVSSVGFAP